MMTQIVIPDVAASQLATVSTPVSICDAAGKVLGTFFPESVHDRDLYAQNPSPLTPDERERRRKEGGKPLAEFFKEMGIQQ